MLRGLFLAIVVLFTTRGLTQKTLTALKSVQAPVIDGKLNDDAWQSAPVATDFIQNSPHYGQPATVKTEVRILYDDNAIYIGARLSDKPSLIRQQFTTRDGEQMQNTDYFSVFFDTYNDQQNGFQFLVTPVNVQSDAKLTASADVSYGSYGDRSWDAVWQSKTSITADGWLVEMRIPYLSLRFSPGNEQTWGLQFLRYVRRENELSFWNPVNPVENGFINQFGKLTHLDSIQPPLRLSLSPYLSGGVRY
ncbi:MAG TPA: carbohydrate binding family 9 domain-containing protein, partial [Flavisolibacter sp.]|nr:carbohydrate binding family 9 domain-containing protein [Flavisolibacter sp.]